MNKSKPIKLNIGNVAKPVKRRRLRTKKKRIPYADMLNQVSGDVSRLFKLFNTEQKYMDYSGSGTQGTAMSIILINGLSQGTTSTTRLGDTIRTTMLELNIRMSVNILSTVGYVVFRVFTIVDLQPNGSTFINSQYLNTPGNVLSAINLPNCKRFNTLDDEMFTLDLNGPNAFVYRRVYNIDIHPEYGLGNAGTIADISKNALFLLLLADDNVNLAGYSYWVRLHYIDN